MDKYLLFVEAADAAPDAEALSQALLETLRDLGLIYVVCGALTRPERYGGRGVVLKTYPEAWSSHYCRNAYLKVDPVVQRVGRTALPFRWSEMNALNDTQRRVLGQASEAGLRDGIAIPVHGPDGDLFCVSAATDDISAVQSASVEKLRLIAVHYHTCLLGHVDHAAAAADLPHLTDRERDSLIYCAMGKTNWEIGQILEISPKTVDFHVGNAMRKLDANSRVLAVVKAIRYGLIVF